MAGGTIDCNMSELELRLKECLLMRPDISSHILTGQELADYTAWMGKEYGKRISGAKREKLIAEGVVDAGDPLMEIGKKVTDDPGSIAQLEKMWGEQFEEVYFRADQDISARRMLRYMPAHWHQNEYFEIYYSYSGTCPIHFTNDVVHLKPGAVLIVAPGVVHANPCYSDDMVLVYYNIRSSTFDQVFWNQIHSGNLMSGFFRQALSGRQSNSYLYFDAEGDAEIHDLLGKVYSEYRKGEDYCNELMNTYMSTCFILLMRRYEGTAKLPRTENFFWKQEYSGILNYMQTHFSTVRLGELAERFHYSEKQVRRIVAAYTGMSYSDLITKLRMERAALLLKRERLSMEDIAETVGYTTVSSFYRAFEAYYKCTPAQYRKSEEK